MSEVTDALKNAIELNREEFLNTLLERLGYSEISEEVFQELLTIIRENDSKRYKYIQALESQEVIDKVLQDRLI